MGKDLKGKDIGKGIRQRADGKYYARFSSKTGKRPEQSFKTLQEARLWLEDQKYLDKHGQLALTNNITLDTWFDYWTEHICKPTVRNTTLITYQSTYRRIIKPMIGCMCIIDIKPLHCQEVLNQDKYAVNSLVEARARMKQLFDAAVDNEYLEKSPLIKSVRVPKRNKKERRVLTIDEQQKFVEHINSSTRVHHRDAFLLILETGMRCGEMMGLKWEDIDFDKRCIHIQRTLVYLKDYGKYEEHPPKTKYGDRIIPLTDTAYELLRQRKSRRLVGMYIFQNNQGKITKAATYNTSLRGICRVIGIERICVHTLRHSFATRCIEKGMQPKTLQKILGHSKLSVTMDLYVHVTENTLFSEMNKMGSITKVG